jgi:hypothetical protein
MQRSAKLMNTSKNYGAGLVWDEELNNIATHCGIAKHHHPRKMIGDWWFL